MNRLPISAPRRGPAATYEARISVLEQALRQIVGRTGSPQSMASVVVVSAAHGFVAGDAVRHSDTGDTWALAQADDTAGVGVVGDHKVGVVTGASTNSFTVTFGGWARLVTPPALTFTLYCLDPATPGAVVAYDTITPDEDVFRQAVYFHAIDGRILIIGPEGRYTHDHQLGEIRDVDDPGAPDDGNWLQWDDTAKRAKWVASAPGAGIPDPGGSDLDFLRFDSGSGLWLGYNLGDVAYNGTLDRIYVTNTDFALAGSNKIRFMGGADIRWVYEGTEAGMDDKWARIYSPATDEMSFEDDGNEVILWTCDPTTAANRTWSFKLETIMVGSHLTIDGTSDVRFKYAATPTYCALVTDTSTIGFKLVDKGATVARYNAHASTAANRKWTWYMPTEYDNGLGDVWKLRIDTSGFFHFALSGTDWLVLGTTKATFYYDLAFDNGKKVIFRGGSGATITDDGTVNGITVAGHLKANNIDSLTGFYSNGVAGVSGTIHLAKLTPGGSNGTITVDAGIITGFLDPT